MKAIRVAYVINSLEGGGAALPAPFVIKEMRGHGALVRLFALSRRDGRAAAALDAAGIDYRVSAAGKADHLRSARWLWKELVEFQPTVIWTSLTQATAVGQILGKLSHVPVVSWQHNAFLKPANHRLLRLTRGLTSLWVADSSSVAQLTAARLGVDPADVMVWPLFRADASAPSAQACPDGARFRLGSLGRLHPNKGYDILIDALALIHAGRPDLPDHFDMIIGGEGAERQSLTERAIRKNVRNLTFAGFESHAPQFLAGLHGYVQPSRGEGLCIAAHEAMQAGLPAIVSEVGEMGRTIQNGKTGYVTPPGDPDALARAIVALVTDKIRSRAMGLKARAHVLDRFSSTRFSEAGLAIFRRLEWI